jgi:hypothetical protein
MLSFHVSESLSQGGLVGDRPSCAVLVSKLEASGLELRKRRWAGGALLLQIIS